MVVGITHQMANMGRIEDYADGMFIMVVQNTRLSSA